MQDEHADGTQDAGFDVHAHDMHEASEGSACENEWPFAAQPTLDSNVLDDRILRL